MNIQALIVDDEPQSVKVLQEKIQWAKLGISKVFGVYSAVEARKILDHNRIQLVLCDIEMPGESGLEFIQWLRDQADLDGKYMECIILTCYPEYSYMRKAMQLGCSDYLIKPIELHEVEKVILKALGKLQESFRSINTSAVNMDRSFTEENDTDHNVIENSVIPYINMHYSEMITVSDIADHACLNPQYMMRLFKKKTGESVLEYVTNLRLEKAKELLRKTSLNNEMISDSIGYASANYFIKLFKTRYGLTPREFRKSMD